MGCLSALRRRSMGNTRKKKSSSSSTTNTSISTDHHHQSVPIRRVSPKGAPTPISAALPEPLPLAHTTRSLQSAPPSFNSRVLPLPSPLPPDASARLSFTTRSRTLSTPEALDSADRDALASFEYDDPHLSHCRPGLSRELQRSPSPHPLSLPSPQASASLRPAPSFKSVTNSNPLDASGPLPLPPGGASTWSLRSFSYDEIMSACCNFSSDRCVSGGLSSLIYKASFGDDALTSNKFEASVTCLNLSSLVMHQFTFTFRNMLSNSTSSLCLARPSVR